MTDRAFRVALLALLMPIGCGERGSEAERAHARLEHIARAVDQVPARTTADELARLFADLGAQQSGHAGGARTDADADAEPAGASAAASPAAPTLDPALLAPILARLLLATPEEVAPEVVLQCAFALRATDARVIATLEQRVASAGDADGYLALHALAHLALVAADARAVPLFARAVAARPEHAEARFFHGFALSLVGDAQAALLEFDAAVARGFDHARAGYHRAVVLLRLGRTEEALATLREIGRSRSAFAGRAWNEAGKILAMHGDVAAAEAAFLSAVERDPLRAAARVNLARLLFERGALDRARSELEQAVALRPGDARAQVLLARTDEEQGNDDDAERRYRAVLRNAGAPADPLSTDAARRLVALLLRNGRAAEVGELREFAAAAALAPASAGN